jgi:hypothetical protein
MFLATVTQASPLRVRQDGATSDSVASVVNRADSWAPALSDRVLVEQIGSRLLVVGELA